MNRTTIQWLLLACGAIVAFAAGVLSRYSRPPEPTGATTAQARQTETEPALSKQDTDPASDKGAVSEPIATEPITLQALLDRYDEATPVTSRAVMRRMIQSLDASQLRRLVEESGNIQSRTTWVEILSVLVERWSELDPESVVRLAIGEEMPEFARYTMLTTGFAELGEVDPSQALELARQTEANQRAHKVLIPLFTAMASVDPRLAASWLDDRSLLPLSDRDIVSWEFYVAWAELDPAAAAHCLSENPTEDNVIAVAEIWAAIDPQSVAAWAARLDSVDRRIDAFSEIVDATTPIDGGEFVLGLLPDLFPGGIPHGAISRLGQQIFAHDIDHGLSWLAGIDDPKQRIAIARNVTRRMGHNHPERADALLQLFSESEGRVRSELIGRLAEPMALKDMDSALAWAESLPEGPDRQTALAKMADLQPDLLTMPGNPYGFSNDQIAQKMGELHDMTTTQAWIDQLPTARQRLDALQIALPHWMDDPAGALAYVEKLDYGESELFTDKRRATTLEKLAKQWGESAPEEASEWAITNGFQKTAYEIRAEAITELVTNGHRDEAVASLNQHLAELQQYQGTFSSATRSIARHWAVRDPEAAADWAETIASQPLRKRAIADVAHYWAEFDPEAASAWVGTLGNSGEREAALGMFYHWSRVEEQAALDALRVMPLSDAERAKALAGFPDGGNGS